MIYMNLRNLQACIYDIEDAFDRRNDAEIKENIAAALKAFNILKADINSKNHDKTVELEDVYAFLKEKRDDYDSPISQMLLGKEMAQKKWYFMENIIESMETVFGTVK